MRSFSKEDQIAQGGAPYIFRLNLGTFGDFIGGPTKVDRSSDDDPTRELLNLSLIHI